jgi:hypothetical protein
VIVTLTVAAVLAVTGKATVRVTPEATEVTEKPGAGRFRASS